MSTPMPELQDATLPTRQHTVLALLVNNHPGVMSHISGLFARRAFNVEGILCLPVGDGSRSRIWLRVKEDQRLDQVVKQLRKLEDVLEVQDDGSHQAIFQRLEALCQP